MELTQRILNSLKGCLGVTVAHPTMGARLRVTGWTDNPVEFGWDNMPSAMKVNMMSLIGLAEVASYWKETTRPSLASM